MSKSVFILLLSILCSGFIQGAPQKDNKAECESRVSACESEGGATTRRPVCGTDSQTYPNRCQLMRAQCLGYPVQVKHRNACSGASQPCSVSLDYAKSRRRSPHEGGAPFIPKCRADGTYAAVQCHSDTGCWCVTPMGKPITNTAVRNGRPKCGSTGGKSNTRRRSSARGQRNKKGCSRADKIQFNLNLIKEFSSEYNRGRSNSPAQGEVKSRVVIDWKFNEMDKDKNGALQKPEYRELRRLIRKVVKPKRCAKTFARVCDIDHDEIISHQEWSNCISSDGLNYEEVGEHDGELGTPDASEFYDDMSSTVVLPGSLRRVQFPDLEDPIDRKEDSDSVDCLSDRKIALDEQKNGDTLYVAECTSDGRYQRVQCYHSTGYCWCVHEDTGKPIPGSSVKDQHPRCEALTVINRPMKGCPDQKKTVFIKDLMDFFWLKMVASTNGSVVSGSSDILKWPASKEEQIATWTFVMLDKDKNKILDRREWKIFHNLITVNAQLKRCGKKLPRYCDVNHDRKISITEWLSCLNAQRGVTVNTTTPSPQSTSTSKRKGPNPLEEYLDYD